jgi:hypothetical protein
MSTPSLPRVRKVQEPLGLYFRPGHNDHKLLCQLVSEAQTSMTGVVFDAQNSSLQEELRREINRRNLHSVLDPKFLEMASPSGMTKALKALPWGGSAVHRPLDFEGAEADRRIEALAEHVVKYEYSAVLAPTHFLQAGGADPWFEIDLRITRLLRTRLQAAGRSDVEIYYPLAMPTKVFFDAAQRQYLKAFLRELSPRSIWLRISPFGSKSGHVTLTQYLKACADLNELRQSLVAEKAGLLSLPLLAFNAVSGVEIGVSSGERFDFSRLKKEPTDSTGFAPHREVYMPDLGVFLARAEAKSVFENRTLRTQLACRNTTCCPRGSDDMVRDTRRHFVLTRMDEVARLGLVPGAIRPSQYLDENLRRVTDRLGRSSQWEIAKPVKEKLERERQRLFGWQQTLGELARSAAAAEPVTLPTRRAARGR